LEACSGLAGLLKSVLILKNGAIPPNIDFKEPKISLKLQEKKNLMVSKSLVRNDISSHEIF
jgi:acyl transferase domain-containing protein